MMNRFVQAMTAAGLLLSCLFEPGTRPALAQTVAPEASATTAATPAPPTPPVKTVDVDPALWVVKDRDTTIYLFGTFHLLKPGLSWFDDGVKTAFDTSDELVTEIIEPGDDSVARLMMSLAVDPDGPPLTQKLSQEGRANYAAAMKELGLPEQAFETLEPWAVALVVQITLFQKMGYGPDAGAEAVLTAEARKTGKKLGELETPEFQIRLLDGMPEAVQIAFLESTVKSLPETGQTLDKMLADWSRGDADSIAALLNESVDETPELHKLMLADRNAKWADWIAKRLDTPGTVFVAVGAGHLAGKDSVQDYLKAKKLKAVRVRY